MSRWQKGKQASAERIVRDFTEGMSVVGLARKYGLTRADVQAVLQRADAATRDRDTNGEPVNISTPGGRTSG